jgi:hypothetical protein
MLYFNQDEVHVCEEKANCALCRERKATWSAKLLTGDRASVCAYCLLYSGKTEWGHDNRAELLEVGRATQEQAAKFRRPLPALDERGRLHPADAEKFAMGVSFTSRMVVDRFGVRRAISD